MSEVLWCDAGNHLFSANDPESTTSIEKLMQYVPESRRPRRTDICGPCNKGQSATDVVRELMAPQRRTAAQVAKAKGNAEMAQRIAELEKELGINQRG